MDFNEDDQIYTYPCPCGDKFEISVVILFKAFFYDTEYLVLSYRTI